MKSIKRTEQVCESGSIEQQLDMCESGPLRGDAILHEGKQDIQDTFHVGYEINLAENDREGAEESGDDHSLGLQGADSEYVGQENAESGLPGELTESLESREHSGFSDDDSYEDLAELNEKGITTPESVEKDMVQAVENSKKSKRKPKPNCEAA